MTEGLGLGQQRYCLSGMMAMARTLVETRGGRTVRNAICRSDNVSVLLRATQYFRIYHCVAWLTFGLLSCRGTGEIDQREDAWAPLVGSGLTLESSILECERLLHDPNGLQGSTLTYGRGSWLVKDAYMLGAGTKEDDVFMKELKRSERETFWAKLSNEEKRQWLQAYYVEHCTGLVSSAYDDICRACGGDGVVDAGGVFERCPECWGGGSVRVIVTLPLDR